MAGKARKLSPRERSFVKQYVIYGNATQAYVTSKYPDVTRESAGVLACRLLKKVKIQDAITIEQKESFKRVDISLDRINKELALIAYSNLSQWINPEDGTLICRPDELPEDVSRAISDLIVITSHGKGGVKLIKHKIKAWDKFKALQELRSTYRDEVNRDAIGDALDKVLDTIAGRDRDLPGR